MRSLRALNAARAAPKKASTTDIALQRRSAPSPRPAPRSSFGKRHLLRKYLRPEFLNRIDEIIVFHALDRAQIREIVGLQLERVKRMAKGQGLTLEFDDSLVDHFAEVGYQPQYGARELRRQIRSQLETQLAGAMLRGDIGEGDTIKFLYDRAADAVRREEQAAAERAGGRAKEEEEEEREPRGREREGSRPPAH